MKIIAIVLVILLVPSLLLGASVTFDIAHSQGSDAWKIVKYLAFMVPAGAPVKVHVDYAVAEIPSAETVFIVENVSIGNWCFAVAGLLSDGRYTPMSSIECIDVEDFFSEYKLKII